LAPTPSKVHQEQLAKAYSHIRQLDIKSALKIFYSILDEEPNNVAIVRKIYPFELKQANNKNFKLLCLRIFSCDSKSQEWHELVLDTFQDFRLRFPNWKSKIALEKNQLFNLFFHLGFSGFTKDIDWLSEKIKSQNAASEELAEALFYYCERLIEKKRIILAKKELKHIITYYGETEFGKKAEVRYRATI